MQKEVYADNVDMNGEAHETVGENIRNGAKSPEAIAKALQSDEITFDMQALMNVLPFMDNSKVIKKVTFKVMNGVWHSDYNEWNPGKNGCGINENVYGYIIGEVYRGNLTLNEISFFITTAPVNTSHLYLSCPNALRDSASDGSIVLYICVNK